MFFNKKDEGKVVKYLFSDEGVEQLASNIHHMYNGSWDENHVMLDDINYLRGVADTMPNNNEMKAIIGRLQNQFDALMPLMYEIRKVEE